MSAHTYMVTLRTRAGKQAQPTIATGPFQAVRAALSMLREHPGALQITCTHIPLKPAGIQKGGSA